MRRFLSAQKDNTTPVNVLRRACDKVSPFSPTPLAKDFLHQLGNSAFAANVHRLPSSTWSMVRTRLSPPVSIISLVVDFGCAPQAFSSHLRRQCPTFLRSSMTALSVEFLWLFGVTLHGAEYVDGLHTDLAPDVRVLLPLPLPLLLTAREFILT